jgi:hypothetical protein
MVVLQKCGHTLPKHDADVYVRVRRTLMETAAARVLICWSLVVTRSRTPNPHTHNDSTSMCCGGAARLCETSDEYESHPREREVNNKHETVYIMCVLVATGASRR